MNNRTRIIIAFILGMVIFLLVFKWLVLNNLPPEDELAPGITLFLGVLSGLVFAYIFSRRNRYFTKKKP